MNQLIKITTNAQGAEVVSARDLYEELGFNKAHWAKWAKKNIETNPFAIERVDWEGFTLSVNGNQTTDYALTTDFAERLCMLARTEKGEQVRRWFQAIKKKALQPMSQVDMLVQSALLLQQHERDIAMVRAVQSEQGEAIRQLEARTLTRPNYFTVMGYAHLHRIQLNQHLAQQAGQRASRLCKDRGLLLDSCTDARYGQVNMYPEPVLAEVFSKAYA